MMTKVGNNLCLAVAVAVVSVGCRAGNPLDRTVKVTQQPSLDDSEFPTPQTRLLSELSSKDEKTLYKKSSPREDSLNSSPHETARNTSRKPENAVAKRSLEHKSDSNKLAKSSKQSSSTAPAANVLASSLEDVATGAPDAEGYTELLEAFRDSPPEVQQQALRQLIAVSSRNAAKTSSPKGIQEALLASMPTMPALPDDSPESNEFPVKLAGGSSPEKVAGKFDGTESDDNKKDDDESASGVVVADSDTAPQTKASGVQLAGAQLTLDREALSKAAPSKDNSKAELGDNLKTIPDATLYAELMSRMDDGVPGESDADRYRRQIISRHLMVFSGNPDGAVAPIDGMAKSEQEFLRHQLLGLWSMVDTSGHPVAARRWSSALPEFRQATQQLAASAESLEVNSLAFCKEIQSFGQVTRFDNNRFEAGQKVILYCEIDNFVAESTASGFETLLQGSYEVFNEKGQKVAGQVLPADKQICANYLRDYFIAYQMSLPSGLDSGTYRLELTMECQKGQKYGQASIPLEIARSGSPTSSSK